MGDRVIPPYTEERQHDIQNQSLKAYEAALTATMVSYDGPRLIRFPEVTGPVLTAKEFCEIQPWRPKV